MQLGNVIECKKTPSKIRLLHVFSFVTGVAAVLNGCLIASSKLHGNNRYTTL